LRRVFSDRVDGKRLIRTTDSDLAKVGNRDGAPHMNFETGRTVVKPNGKEQFISEDNLHISFPRNGDFDG
jgi:hypothetical protein